MKPALLFVLLLLQASAIGQLTFEAVAPPEDMSMDFLRKSPTGEYFLQLTNDAKSVYSSMNGVDWAKAEIPFASIADIQFYSDGTPVLHNSGSEQLIRRNNTWYTLDPGAGWDDVFASHIKDDTLFIFQANRFAYSADKGQTYTVLFNAPWDIPDRDAQLWAIDDHFVMYHFDGPDSLTVFTRDGIRVAAYELDLDVSPNIIYNACGEVLFIDNEQYHRFREQDLTLTKGKDTDVLPSKYSYFDLRSRDGNYYARHLDTLFISVGCTIDWQPFLVDDNIFEHDKFHIAQGEDLLFYTIHSNSFVEQKDRTNTWTAFKPAINYANITGVHESAKDHQLVHGYYAKFRKLKSDSQWTKLDSTTAGGDDIQYAPDGGLYIAKTDEILYSKDNGITFSTIPIPVDQPGISLNYHLEVVDNDILFLYRYRNLSFLSTNNGHDWKPVQLTDRPKDAERIITRAGNYLQVAHLEQYYYVERAHLGTGEVTSHDIGDFALNYSGGAVLDDGTMYFRGRNLNNSTERGIFRYEFGGIPEYLGNFSEFSTGRLFASGPHIFKFGLDKYHVLTGNTVTTYPCDGITEYGEIYFYVTSNQHVFAVLNRHSLFRSTTPLTYPTLVSGSVYLNRNETCVRDTLDPKLADWQVRIENDSFLRIVNTDTRGNYTMDVPYGTYEVSTTAISDHWDVCGDAVSITVDSANSTVNQDFLATILHHCADLKIDFSTPRLRRCFENIYFIEVTNTGPEPSEGTVVRLILDPFFEFISATIPHTQIADHTFEFDLGVLEVNEKIRFQIRFTLSCDAELGAEHCLKGQLIDDALCDNERDSYTECQENIGAYDPNDKRIFNEAGLEAAQVDKGEFIYYHIRFQNTGTDTAFKVHILDPLSPMLDYSTLEMLSASHPYTWLLTDGPALSVLFENILLPDSNINEPASHGYVKFRIKPLPAFDYGTIIPNTAGIYFDFNDPVLTNQATLVILPLVKTVDVEKQIQFDVYPNPATTTIQLSIEAAAQQRVDAYEIVDQWGRVVFHATTLQDDVIDVATLVPGMYTLLLKERGVLIGSRNFVKTE